LTLANCVGTWEKGVCFSYTHCLARLGSTGGPPSAESLKILLLSRSDCTTNGRSAVFYSRMEIQQTTKWGDSSVFSIFFSLFSFFPTFKENKVPFSCVYARVVKTRESRPVGRSVEKHRNGRHCSALRPALHWINKDRTKKGNRFLLLPPLSDSLLLLLLQFPSACRTNQFFISKSKLNTYVNYHFPYRRRMMKVVLL